MTQHSNKQDTVDSKLTGSSSTGLWLIREEIQEQKFLLQLIHLFISTTNTQCYASIHVFGSFFSDHAIREIKRQTVFVICALKVAATSTLSVSPSSGQPPEWVIYFNLGQRLFVFITDGSRLANIRVLRWAYVNVEVISY